MILPGEAAKRARERKELTRKELARRAGVPINVVSRFERGKSDPRLSTVELLADTLGLSIDEYVGHFAKK